jgi:hypothetical protein
MEGEGRVMIEMVSVIQVADGYREKEEIKMVSNS